jgi:hypothetical protein
MVRFSRKQRTKLKPIARRPQDSGYDRQAVFSYRASRIEKDRQFDRGTTVEANSNSRWRQIPVILALIAILITVLYGLGLSTNAQLVVNGDQAFLRQKAAYNQLIDDKLAGSIWNRSKLTINTAKVEGQIKTAFPELESVTISTPLFRHRPVVEVTLAKPAALLVTPNETYVLDGHGRALFNTHDKAPLLDVSKLPAVTDQSGHQITLGKPGLTEDQVSYVRQLFLQSDAKQLSIESMTLQAGGGELYVKFTGVSYFVKFNFTADPRQSIGAYFAIKERLDQDHKTVGEYIDVRIPERVFVK